MMTAFNTVVTLGLTPHSKQGGMGREASAVSESKLDGTGLEKEQIGHIHVPHVGCTDAVRAKDPTGLLVRETGDDTKARTGDGLDWGVL